MKNFQSNDSRGGGFRPGGDRGRDSFQKKSWGGDRGNDRDRQMFKATCGNCGKSCEVPFRPTGEKPVYCNDCFGKMRDSERSTGRPEYGASAPKRDFGDRRDSRSDFKPKQVFDDTKKQLTDISIKLDRLLGIMEKMMESKKEVQAKKSTTSLKDTLAKVVAKKEVKKSSKKKSATNKK